MNVQTPDGLSGYDIDIQPLLGVVTISRDGILLAASRNARVMYETRLAPTIYFPVGDVCVDLGEIGELQTFCPFKGTASYRDLTLNGKVFTNAVWSYDTPLPESDMIRGYVGFMGGADLTFDLGDNTLRERDDGNISGPLVDWLMRGAGSLKSPEDLTRALTEKMIENGICISRLSVMTWSLHPQIAGKNYLWNRQTNEITTRAPSYEIYDTPAFINSPLLHVAKGLGGVRQKLDDATPLDTFPVLQELKDQGATDYVAMPLPFSDGRINVLTMTCDHAHGFTTANLGLVFECVQVIGRFYEVFTQRENARSLLEAYVGKRSGARVLGGEIRRGDGDDIDAAIMFCDLRNSTVLEERLGRVKYIDLLNEFFEVTSDVVHENGGEVLKFIGDAVLAVFPGDEDAESACARALKSSKEIANRLSGVGPDPCSHPCDCSIGIDFGQVTYGNVGSRERLDFTVIGRAANVAARLGDYGKSIGHRIVVSRQIAGAGAKTATDMIDLGPVSLRNVSRPVESFAVLASKPG